MSDPSLLALSIHTHNGCVGLAEQDGICGLDSPQLVRTMASFGGRFLLHKFHLFRDIYTPMLVCFGGPDEGDLSS